MKIILVDNYDRDTVPERVIAAQVDDRWAPKIASLLNENYSGDRSPDFFRVVGEDYQLKTQQA